MKKIFCCSRWRKGKLRGFRVDAETWEQAESYAALHGGWVVGELVGEMRYETR
jgi:hypothetical protein